MNKKSPTIDEYTIKITTDKLENSRIKSPKSESELIKNLLSELKENDIFYDIGANIGIYSLLAAKIISTGEIHSFEPHPTNYDILNNNININNITNIQTHNIALYDECREINFDPIDIDNETGKAHINENGEIQIKAKRIDDLSLKSPNIVKIDVEGAEAKILFGMNNNIISECRVIYIETHPEKMNERYNTGINDIVTFAQKYNMKMDLLFSRGAEKFYKLQK